ncbi:MAG TPA: hypothetical protein VFN25_10100 [Dokdonella sp.]|uniref:hypothetical protein n=1 Tax=Dokdonella sp. TaxID=2291710 RepID=UPI002D810E2A|nr:hypothetical protein [Dokdonella sp.]HET9033246.1 hypothetical protein [Dokdonella sp.]
MSKLIKIRSATAARSEALNFRAFSMTDLAVFVMAILDAFVTPKSSTLVRLRQQAFRVISANRYGTGLVPISSFHHPRFIIAPKIRYD